MCAGVSLPRSEADEGEKSEMEIEQQYCFWSNVPAVEDVSPAESAEKLILIWNDVAEAFLWEILKYDLEKNNRSYDEKITMFLGFMRRWWQYYAVCKERRS